VWITEVFSKEFIYEQDGKLFKRTYSKSDNGITKIGKPVEVIRKIEFVTSNKEIEMSKKTLIDSLISNCECWSEEDREALEGFSEAKLNSMNEDLEKESQRLEVVNAAMAGFNDADGNSFVFNEETREWDRTDKEPETKEPEVTANNNTTQKKEPQTAEEWLASAPPGIQSAVQNAMAIEANEKKAIINKLISHLDDDAKKVVANRLNSKPLDELRDLAMLSPKEEPVQQFNLPNYAGASVPVGNFTQEPEYDKSDVMPLPTINWAEERKLAANS
jgi:hypothetical protein